MMKNYRQNSKVNSKNFGFDKKGSLEEWMRRRVEEKMRWRLEERDD
jgi:hypothetical protein